MVFIITEHAKKRMEERNIPDPNSLNLFPAGRNTKKKIRESCKKHGFKNYIGSEYIYFRGGKYVFVCLIETVATYKVLTALEY